ncbi:MAG TPA: dockerin type I domain-containing protein, partial [Patescibacteria group bacterium]|nr:dockerin type I domain-containing protein [Patescibacteria group bacterium]
YGRLQITQTSDMSDQGIAVLNTAGTRTMRLWVDGDVSTIDSSSDGIYPIMLNTGGGPVSVGGNLLIGGRVGIGTTAPATSVEIRDDNNTSVAVLRITDSFNNPEIQLRHGTGNNNHWAIYNEQSNDSFRIWNNNSNRLVINADGRVGIGIDNPNTDNLYVAANRPSDKTSITVKNNATISDDNTRAQICLDYEGNFCLVKRGNNGIETWGGEDGVAFWNSGPGDYVWASNGVETLRLKEDGVLDALKVDTDLLVVNSQSMFGSATEVLTNSHNLIYGNISSDSTDNSNLLLLQTGTENQFRVTREGAVYSGNNEIITKLHLLSTSKLYPGSFAGDNPETKNLGYLALVADVGYLCEDICVSHNLICNGVVGYSRNCLDSDVNNDDSVDAIDLQIITNCVVFSNCSLCNSPNDCDIDNDGNINVLDYQLVLNALSGICRQENTPVCEDKKNEKICKCGRFNP